MPVGLFTFCRKWDCIQCSPGTGEPVYIKNRSQHCNNSAMKLAILFSLKTMELLQTEVATHFSQSCGSVDADAWYRSLHSTGDQLLIGCQSIIINTTGPVPPVPEGTL